MDMIIVADLRGRTPKFANFWVNGGFDFGKQKETIKEPTLFKHY
jgi:hypothetical protein